MIAALLIVLLELLAIAGLGFRAILRKGDSNAAFDAAFHARIAEFLDAIAREENRARCREFGVPFIDYRPGLGWMAVRPLPAGPGGSAPELVRFASCESEAVWLIHSGRI